MIDNKNIFIFNRDYKTHQIEICPIDSTVYSSLVFSRNPIKYCKTSIKDQSKIFFLKNAVVPKLNLGTTSFTRTIKLNKADYIVTDFIKEYLFRREIIIQHKENYYIIPFGYSVTQEEISTYVKEHFFTDFEIISTDSFFAYYKFDQCEIVFDPKFKDKLYLDMDFNSLIVKTFPSLTDESFETIKTMLNSPDISTQDLGLKTLAATNYTECPLKVNYLLAIHNYTDLPGWNSILVKIMRKTFIIKNNRLSTGEFLDYVLLLINTKSYHISDLDLKFFQPLWLKRIEYSLKKENYKRYNAVGFSFQVNIKINDNEECDINLNKDINDSI